MGSLALLFHNVSLMLLGAILYDTNLVAFYLPLFALDLLMLYFPYTFLFSFP
jgi:hypothetical protein